MSGEREVRLVLRQQDSRVFAFVYPRAGGTYTAAELVFPVASEQELPRLEPGAVVCLTGTAKDPALDAGGVVIRRAGRPGADDRRGAMQILGERGDVIAHPDVVGWGKSWRSIQQASTVDPQTWRRRLRRRIVTGWSLMLTTVVLLVAALVGKGGVAAWHLTATGGSILADIAAWRAARRARHAVEAAERSLAAPGVPGQMRLWWSAGDGLGPLAVATLFDIDTSGDIDVPIVGLPIGGSTPEGRVDVVIHRQGDSPPVIRWNGNILWPAGPVRQRGGNETERQTD